MSFKNTFEKIFRTFLPSPFSIAILLSLLSLVLATLFGKVDGNNITFSDSLNYWFEGMWTSPLLAFAIQMMLILVLGHALALAKPVKPLIDKLLLASKTPFSATFIVCFSTLLMAFFNWGLALIFGALIARATAEKFSRESKAISYPLLAAAGYVGLMVWHGGLSGSAPLKAAEEGHLDELMHGSQFSTASLPSDIPLQMTIFSDMNLLCSLALLIFLPLLMAWVASKVKGDVPQIATTKENNIQTSEKQIGAEKLDHSLWWGSIIGGMILLYGLYRGLYLSENFLNLNYLNFLLLGLGLVFHGSIQRYSAALEEAIGGSVGILIQFPLYFGIMGLMKSSGLIGMMSEFFISISNTTTFPLLTFISAGIVNIFVPSGGGQWAIQGPIVIQASRELGVPMAKSIMALAYGDQITNMLQPFWALPLLGITGLKARDILPYTLILFVSGLLIFLGVLLIF